MKRFDARKSAWHCKICLAALSEREYGVCDGCRQLCFSFMVEVSDEEVPGEQGKVGAKVPEVGVEDAHR